MTYIRVTCRMYNQGSRIEYYHFYVSSSWILLFIIRTHAVLVAVTNPHVFY